MPGIYFAGTIMQGSRGLRKHGILGPLALSRFFPDLQSAYLVAVTEKRTPADLDRLIAAIEEVR